MKFDKKPVKFKELFDVEGAIRNVIAISAYSDIETIQQLIKHTKDRADARVRPSLKIFIDKASSHFNTDKTVNDDYLKANKKILNFCDENSGIFLVQIGGLFHSKAFYVESNNYAKIIIGSMNLTTKGISGNEEIVIVSEMNVNGKAKANELANRILDYSKKNIKEIHTS
jgi:phosphatidylserine/phosphatidylglycerophosphate/cardiolipin synthase-like enzyme